MPVDIHRFRCFLGVQPIIILALHSRRIFQSFLGGVEDQLRLITFFGNLERKPGNRDLCITDS